jgi:hypothetical protein
MMTIHEMSAWVWKEFDRRRRAWLWAASHLVAAGRAESDGKKSVGRELWEDSECIALLLLAEPCA